ncbi:MAG: ImmA/IrrE family metallo-endopeptidase [Parvularculaceae bacterium]
MVRETDFRAPTPADDRIAARRWRRTSFVAAFAVVATSPSAAPLPANDLPQPLLAACDARARPFGAYDGPIADAAAALIEIGVFGAAAFRDVKIGFCGLRRAGGPVATAACASDVILLDEKYAAPGEALTLKATLAHEMKHYFQHKDRKARFGAGYCASARYDAEAPALEREADAFGHAVGELFLTGRPIDIVNDCPDAALIYLEADRPVWTAGAPRLQRIPPRARVPSTERAASRRFKYNARTAPSRGAPREWRGAQGAHARIVDGARYYLKPIVLENAGPTDPFELTLSCDAAPDG